jgi:hypothetical protein
MGTSQTYKMSDLFRLTEVQMEHLRPFSPKSRGSPSWGRVIRYPRVAVVRQGTNSTCNERHGGPLPSHWKTVQRKSASRPF